ncbi:MAG: hypothetical protein BGO67_07310 [Alphaproteobacteria bacterium 41-28]|nr:MAG: hypothetical protein BGO67_07310 [Alphaproteobacteria bacterium 41-28]
MKVYNIKEMIGGWYIGNFEPSVYKTETFEVSLKNHPKGEVWPKHYHKEATEINLIVKGEMNLNNISLKAGDIFIIDKMEVVDPDFLEDCLIVCVKVPSVLGDKYIVSR